MNERTEIKKEAKPEDDGAGRLQAQMGELFVSIKTIILPPTICKVNGGPEIHIDLKGASLNLDGYGYPTDGQGLLFNGTLTEIPPTPGDGSSNLPTATLTAVGYYPPNTGKWLLELNDVAGNQPRTRTVVIWHRYFNAATSDELFLPDAATITIPAFDPANPGSIPDCT